MISVWMQIAFAILNCSVAENFLGRTRYYVFSVSGTISDFFSLLLYGAVLIHLFSYMGIRLRDVLIGAVIFNISVLTINIPGEFKVSQVMWILFSSESGYIAEIFTLVIGFFIVNNINFTNHVYIPKWPKTRHYIVLFSILVSSRLIFFLAPALISTVKSIDLYLLLFSTSWGLVPVAFIMIASDLEFRFRRRKIKALFDWYQQGRRR